LQVQPPAADAAHNLALFTAVCDRRDAWPLALRATDDNEPASDDLARKCVGYRVLRTNLLKILRRRLQGRVDAFDDEAVRETVDT